MSGSTGSIAARGSGDKGLKAGFGHCWLREGAALGFLLLAPALLFIIVTIIYPMLYSFVSSFYEWNLGLGSPTFVGLGNYLRIFRDTQFWESLGTTLVYTFSSVALELVLGLGVAMLLRRNIPGAGVFRALFALPFVVTPVVVALIWRWLFNPDYGLVPWVLGNLGVANPDLLGNTETALGAVVAVDVWQTTGFMFVLLLAGLQAIPDEVYEASRVDGATPWQSFLFITLPLLKPVLLVALLLRTMDTIKGFDKIFVLTGGGPGTSTEVLPLLVYDNAFKYFNVGYGAALSYILTFVVLLISVFYMCMLRTTD